MPLVLVVQVCQKSRQSKRLKKAVIMHEVGSLPRSEDKERENGSKNEMWQKRDAVHMVGGCTVPRSAEK